MSNKVICDITKKLFDPKLLVLGRDIRTSIFNLIQKDHPDFTQDSHICHEALNHYRKIYLENILSTEVGNVSTIEKEVIQSISDNELLSNNIELEFDSRNTLGQRVADKVAGVGGSWVFIIGFFTFLGVWVLINTIVVLNYHAFDPYPFTFLNLVLSCLAAIQAPVIMMSQNRKEERDRKRSEYDYKTNLKAELEIRLLHEKVDYLLMQQSKNFVEIQQIQMDLMEDILKVKEKK